MSEYAEIVPGFWTIRCVDYQALVCQGPMFSPEAGVVICEAHARLRGLLPEPGTAEAERLVPSGVEPGQVAEPPTSISDEPAVPLEPGGGA